MFLKLLLLLSLLNISDGIPFYKVVASRISTSTLISKAQGSSYDYNYNAAIFTDEDDALGLLVRCQNLKNASVPFDVSQSYIVYSNLTKDNDGNLVATPPKTENSIPTNDQYGESCGTEDPRIAFYNGTYYLFYTAYDCKRAMLSVMTSQTPWDPTSWKREGFVIPGRNWSKSGAALFMTEDNGLSQHYLFWGDSSTPEGGIGICTSSDGKNWTDTGKYLMKIRNDINPFFDSNLVESGPSPIQLKTGDFLFIYNSAQAGYTSVKPNWQLQYNVGYVILDKTDPTQVVQRSNNPILSPVQDWEIGNDNSKSYLTPNVVFLEGKFSYFEDTLALQISGLIRDPDGCPANVQDIIGQEFAGNAECFIGVYGGSDSDLGAVRIVASYVDQPGTSTISSTCACVSTNTCSSLSTCRTETTCTCSNEDKNPTSDTTPSVTTQSGTTQSGTTQSGTTQSGTTQSGTTPSGTTQGNAAGTTFPNVVTVVISAFLTLILF